MCKLRLFGGKDMSISPCTKQPYVPIDKPTQLLIDVTR